jgi:hypothetical protein
MQVLASFDDPSGSPAILSRRVGAGDVFLFTTSGDDEWTDWPRSQAGRVTYVSLMQWLVQHGAGASGSSLNLTGGSPMEFVLDPARYQSSASLRPPAGAEAEPVGVRVAPAGEGRGLRFVSDPLLHAGVWELQLREVEGGSRSAFVAVNPPPEERALQRARTGILTRVSLSPGRLQVRRYDDRLLAGLLGGPFRYWPGLVVAILGLLIVESVLAYVFSAGDVYRGDRA